jgi:hypothetical protein
MDTPRMSPKLVADSVEGELLTTLTPNVPKLSSWVLATAVAGSTVVDSLSKLVSSCTDPLQRRLNRKLLWHCLWVLNPKDLPSLE